MTQLPRYAVGLDYGTSSCRGLVVDLDTGREVAQAVFDYPGGHHGVLDDGDHLVARQHPADYVEGLEVVLRESLASARAADPAFDPAAVVGIGVATTGSTPMPVDASGRPLALDPAFAGDLNAMAWLWKDHSAQAEAEAITAAALQTHPEYVEGCGSVYSAEWFWAKIWRCLRVAPDVFHAAASWVELCDLVPAVLMGVDDVTRIPRSLCAAGHKAMFSDRWGGLPGADFLVSLDPALAKLRSRLYDDALPAGERAGRLGAEWAARTGLLEGTPIATGAFDSHAGALASGVAEGVLVKVMGTSTCDLTVQQSDHAVLDLPGICGVVPGSVLAGFAGIEAGQSGVGDMFRWFVDGFVPAEHGATTADRYASLTAEIEQLAPGEHGLMALDWVNGNRSILVDHRLSGLLVGLTLHTRPHHVLQALIEATAFGALRIVERLEEYGVRVDEIVAAGGLPGRNPMLMQTYADVVGRRIRVVATDQASALGAAMLGALAAGAGERGFATPADAQERLVRFHEREYTPQPAAQATYRGLYDQYRRLHDAFGLPGAGGEDLRQVMLDLFALKGRAAEVVR